MKKYAPKIKKMALLCSILKKGGLESFLRLLEALLRQALLHSGMISILYKHILISISSSFIYGLLWQYPKKYFSMTVYNSIIYLLQMTEGKYDAIRPVLIEELHKFHFFCKGLLFFELLSKGVFH